MPDRGDGGGSRKAQGRGQLSSRRNRPWKDATNPTTASPDEEQGTEGSPLEAVSDAGVDAQGEETATQGQNWQTGAGAGGATESPRRRAELESSSDQAGLKK
jgi:hypothetical protein